MGPAKKYKLNRNEKIALLNSKIKIVILAQIYTYSGLAPNSKLPVSLREVLEV